MKTNRRSSVSEAHPAVLWPSGRNFTADNLKAVLALPHREDSIDTTLNFSNVVFRFAYTANNAYNAKFRVRGRVTSKRLRGTALSHNHVDRCCPCDILGMR